MIVDDYRNTHCAMCAEDIRTMPAGTIVLTMGGKLESVRRYCEGCLDDAARHLKLQREQKRRAP